VVILNAVVATVAGLLPVRWWSRFDARLPVRRVSALSGLVTMLTGFALGIPGYFAFLEEAVAGGNEALLALGAGQATPFSPQPVWTALSPLAFALFTPLGLLSSYLCVSGLVRGVSAWMTDDPRGDPLLTAVDAAAYRATARVARARRRRARERLEGPEAPDRLVTGAWAGLSDVDFIVLASRRKPGWDPGVFVITTNGWYRLGRPFDMPLPSGLRTAYPLTKIETLDVLRKGVPYELPPLSDSDRPPATGAEAAPSKT